MIIYQIGIVNHPALPEVLSPGYTQTMYHDLVTNCPKRHSIQHQI
jgi:hypothetical protein